MLGGGGRYSVQKQICDFPCRFQEFALEPRPMFFRRFLIVTKKNYTNIPRLQRCFMMKLIVMWRTGLVDINWVV